MTWSNRTAAALVTACLVLSTVRASPAAPTDSPGTRAKAHFVNGNRRFRAGDFAEALEAYRRARRLFARAGRQASGERTAPLRRNVARVTLNIADALTELGRADEAADTYQRFLDDADRLELAHRHRDRAQQRLAILRRALARVTVSCVEATCSRCPTVPCAVLVRDSSQNPLRSLDGKRRATVHLRPGEYHIAVEHDGFTPVSAQLRLSAGQTLDLPVKLHRVPVVRSTPTNKATIVRPKPRRQARQDHETPGRPLLDTAAWTSLAVGLASSVSAAMLYTIGAVNGQASHQRYLDARDPVSVQNQWDNVEAARQKIEVGHVLAGVGGAALVTAAILFVLDRGRKRPATVTASASGNISILLLKGEF